MKDQFLEFGYYITSEPLFQNEKYGVTPELQEQFESLLSAARDEKDKKIIDKLSKLIEKYPKAPILKNYLSLAYHVRGNYDKALMVNTWILVEHPDYLFARVNEAHRCIDDGNLDKVPVLLGEMMEIKLLYPERDVFHISEVTGFFRCAVRYFVACGDEDQAESRINVLREVAPDHPDTMEAERYLLAFPTEFAKWFMGTGNTNTSTKGNKNKRKPKHTQAPSFTHPVIHQLYTSGLDISHDILKEIINLPRESAVEDLERVLEDAVERFDFFAYKPLKDDKLHAPLHAIFLLKEIGAVESLHKVLSFLQSAEEVLGLWIGEHITETLWQSLYSLGLHKTDSLRDFLLMPEVHTFCKTAVSESLGQIALHHPERREEIIRVFNSVFTEFVNTGPDHPLLDDTFIGLCIADTVDCGFIELLPVIKKLHELGYVDLSVNGTYADVVNEFERYSEHNYKRELHSIFELYDHVLTTWAGYNDDFEEDDEDDEDYENEIFNKDHYDTLKSKFILPDLPSSPKIGRNDPCPCGSGLKYKKCCGEG